MHSIFPSLCHLGKKPLIKQKGVRELEESELFEDKHDAAVCDLLGQLEEESYTQLVKKVANGSINALVEARHITSIMKAVGLI